MPRWPTVGARPAIGPAQPGQSRRHQISAPLAGHNPNSPTDDYHAYLQRALFFNACARTIEALAGMIFRSEPVIRAPKLPNR